MVVRGKSLRVLSSLLLLVLLVGRTVEAGELSAEKRQKIDAAVERFQKKIKIPGLSISVVVHGEPAYERGYGLTDIENNVAATPESVYRLASISKMLTAVAVMQLVEQGKLDLQAPIQAYVPGFPEKQAPITCDLLLKHQSGIRHYRGNENASARPYAHVRDSFDVFQNDPLLFAPGERYNYTTYGYNVLGAAIEGASGEDYVSYVQKHIAEPAGMVTLRPDSPYKLIPHRAAGYRRSGPLVINDIMVDVSNKIPGGGWCSTSGDLTRFATALMAGKLVKPETLEQMWVPQKTGKGVQTTSGYGCTVRTVDGDRRISHSGGQAKVSTFLTFSPAKQASVAVMANLQGTRVQALADELLGIGCSP